ncbi:PTS sugar transporter subunit IIA [Neobacillus pocheonensis]|uniref:PTS sugar transporter subunit IIA n=1 Tax=Neobacillus pocheonensis TaxID=363869 RepID=UPI003D2B03A2
MQLQALTSPSLISTGKSFSSKKEVIQYLVKQLGEAGKLHSEQEFLQSVFDREKLSPTGFEGGLAIPHGKSTSAKEAAFAVATLKTPVTDWESIDPNNKVQLKKVSGTIRGQTLRFVHMVRTPFFIQSYILTLS